MSLFNMEEFKKNLESEMQNLKQGTSPKELAEDFFKASVAKLLECYIEQNERDTIESDFVEVLLADLINCFRNADLGNAQRSVEDYEALYRKAMQEIFANAHSKGNITTETDSQGYVRNDGGLYVPGYLR